MTQALPPPSKNLLSKQIVNLFHTENVIIRDKGDRYSAYKNLTFRAPIPTRDSFIIPDHCSALTTEDNELKIICKREFIVNGTQLACSVLFGQNKTYLTVNETPVTLNIHIPPSQETIEGMVFLMENINICKGVPCDASCSNGEKWATILNTSMLDCRKRSNTCKKFLSFGSKIEFCEPCAQKQKRDMKVHNRRTSNDHTSSGKCIKRKNDSEISETIAIPEKIQKPSTSSPEERDCDESIANDSTLISELKKTDLPEKFKALIISQLKNSQKGINPKARRWDFDFISICLTMYVRSPAALEDLRKSDLFVLPSVRLLQLYKNCIKQKPGVNQDNFTWMAREAERQKIPVFGKRGGLILDEMSLQDDLTITRKDDTWLLTGECDMGETNNAISTITTKSKKVELATHCLQYMYHGFTGFRWPVSFYASNPASTHQLYLTLWECVDQLDEIGFTVDYVMFDGASTNRSLTSLLLNENPRGNKFMAKNIYDSTQTIFIIQDPKHVIKKIRNNVESSLAEHKSSPGRYLSCKGKCILWEHWGEAFNFNYQRGLRIHYKLTKEHIELTGANKMRNKLAEEVLSKDMLYLMQIYQSTLDYPERLSATIEFLENTSLLVDFFSDKRVISTMSDKRFSQLSGVLKYFNDWETQVKESHLCSETKHLMTVETREDINSCITGLLGMASRLLDKGEIPSITPAYLNSDIVENHFCQQRGTCNGLNTNPTLAQYGTSNTAICLGQTSVSSKGNSSTKALPFNATTPCPLNKNRKKNKSTSTSTSKPKPSNV